MTFDYDLPLAEYPYLIVRLECRDCDRTACYRLTRLVATYGMRIDLFHLLGHLVEECPRWNLKSGSPDNWCEAYFPDMLTGDPPDLPPTPPTLRIVK